jgi:hypothetical protein
MMLSLHGPLTWAAIVGIAGIAVRITTWPTESTVQASATGSPMVHAGFFDWLFGGPTPNRSQRQKPRVRKRPKPEPTIKTVCVRLCDGYYFPISQSVKRNAFKRDAERCNKSCPIGARLFIVSSPNGKPEDMVDLAGQPYRALPTAFQHQTHFNPACTCRGNPWDAERLAEHLRHARETAKETAHELSHRGCRSQDRNARC